MGCVSYVDKRKISNNQPEQMNMNTFYTAETNHKTENSAGLKQQHIMDQQSIQQFNSHAKIYQKKSLSDSKKLKQQQVKFQTDKNLYYCEQNIPGTNNFNNNTVQNRNQHILRDLCSNNQSNQQRFRKQSIKLDAETPKRRSQVLNMGQREHIYKNQEPLPTIEQNSMDLIQSSVHIKMAKNNIYPLNSRKKITQRPLKPLC